MGSVRTPILGRPRPSVRDRRADRSYTLNCEEPVIPCPSVPLPCCRAGWTCRCWTPTTRSTTSYRSSRRSYCSRRNCALGVEIERPVEVGDLDLHTDGVLVTGQSPGGGRIRLCARYVVGCDGRRSTVRAAAGITLTGSEATLRDRFGEVLVRDADLTNTTRHTDEGSFYAVQIEGRRFRLITVEREDLDSSSGEDLEFESLDFEEFRRSVVKIAGTDFGMHDPSRLTRVGSATYQADQYRRGRVLLAGDAAHVHLPIGGQGLNLGLQDALNLGWKLAAVLRGVAGEDLLDSYHTERAAVGKAVIENVQAQTAVVSARGREGTALRNLLSGALTSHPSFNRALAGELSGIDTAYSGPTGAHRLVGHRAPNLELADGSRLFTHLASARFCLVGVPRLATDSALAEELVRTEAPVTQRPDWQGVRAVLVRPDGYVAWVADESTPAHRLASDAVDALRGQLSRLVTLRSNDAVAMADR
jgi:2-polyprenyl-6-methoxyphenol hydroxylase-like FAD-dependent oxidoreductase